MLIQVSCLCSIVDAQLKFVEGELSKGMLENNTCYLLDCGAEVFVWVGRVTQVDERKSAIQAAEVECRGSSCYVITVYLNPNLSAGLYH